VPFCKTLFSSLAEAVKALAESNARRAELENELEEARAQLRSAKTKDFNAGRLFRLEIENSEFQRELDLYKGALEDARQQILLNAQQRQVALPLEIESLRHDLSAAESALKCAEASRDAAVQEMERFRLEFNSSMFSPLSHRSATAAVPDMRPSTSKSFIAAASSSPSAQSLINFSAHNAPRRAPLVSPHTPAPASLAGIGVRMYLDALGRLAVQESAIVLNTVFFFVLADARLSFFAVFPGGGADDSGALAVDGKCALR
jgi:hypothetical protein